MIYEITGSKITSIKVSEDELSVEFDVTIFYRAENADKTPSSSAGNSFTLSLESGERNTMVDELNTKVFTWFNENFNS